MPAVRDLNKAKRRDAILDAAMSLFGERANDDITTEEIAALAGVAPATVYNLIGTRSQVLTALVVRVLGRLAESLAELDPDQPIEAAQLVVDQTVAAFVANSKAFRQVVAIAQRSAANHQLGIDPSEFQVAAMRRAQELGIIRPELDAGALGRQIFLSYTGALTLWSAGRLDDEGFATAARHGLFTVLVAAATDGHRAPFVEAWQQTGAALEHDAWHRTRPSPTA
ncbi:MAG: TetR/AcrR family transcriptional regulator [Ilumatobacteraceae bacterium]